MMEHYSHPGDADKKDPEDDAKSACAFAVVLFSAASPLCGLAIDKGSMGLAIGLGAGAAIALGISLIAYLSIGKTK